MSHELLLEAIGLEKTFRVGFWRRKVEAVRGVSFNVHRGEIFGLVGPNGAGKTTVMKMLTGLIFADEGQARLFGRPVSEVETRRRLGYLPENPYFYERLTARELVAYYGRLHGLDSRTISKRSDELLERVDLTHAADRPIGKFSKGMRQRAGIAQALVNDPDLVILDEPQSGLDPVGRKEVRDLLVELKEEGKTVFLSSHILPDVEAVCDRVAVMHEGTIREIGSLDELTSERQSTVEFQVKDLEVEQAEAIAGVESASRQGNVVVLRCDGAIDVDRILDDISQHGGRIHSVTPHKENLEDVFMRDTEATQ
ncbi:MAG: ATP-binding cassette domain-containing protein [Persicimonas sp.]